MDLPEGRPPRSIARELESCDRSRRAPRGRTRFDRAVPVARRSAERGSEPSSEEWTCLSGGRPVPSQVNWNPAAAVEGLQGRNALRLRAVLVARRSAQRGSEPSSEEWTLPERRPPRAIVLDVTTLRPQSKGSGGEARIDSPGPRLPSARRLSTVQGSVSSAASRAARSASESTSTYSSEE